MKLSRAYRLVLHERVLDYLCVGWHIAEADLGPPHSEYAVLLGWLCDCDLVEPSRPAGKEYRFVEGAK